MKTVARCRPVSTGGLWSRLLPSRSVSLKRGPAPSQCLGTAAPSKSKLQGSAEKNRACVVAESSPSVAFTLPAVVAPAGVVSCPSAEISPETPSRLQAAFSLRRNRPLSSNDQASKANGSPAFAITSPGTTSSRAALASAAGAGSAPGDSLLVAAGLNGAPFLPRQNSPASDVK